MKDGVTPMLQEEGKNFSHRGEEGAMLGLAVMFLVLGELGDDVVWARVERKTPSTEVARVEFVHAFRTAAMQLLPGIEVNLEIPETTLYLEGQHVRAVTSYDFDRGSFLTRADLAELVALPSSMRVHMANHEICHLVEPGDRERLKVSRPLADTVRMAMEMRAERCAFQYEAAGEPSVPSGP